MWFFFKFYDLKYECLPVFLWGLWALTVTVWGMSSVFVCASLWVPRDGLPLWRLPSWDRAVPLQTTCDRTAVWPVLGKMPAGHCMQLKYLSASVSIVDTLTLVQTQQIHDCWVALRPRHHCCAVHPCLGRVYALYKRMRSRHFMILWNMLCLIWKTF